MQNEKSFIDDTEITNLRDLISLIIEKKFYVISFVSFFSIGLFAYSLLLPNIYTSKALLAPADQENSISSSLAQYSTLAGLAGVNLPNDTSSKKIEATERISSFDFFKDYFLPNIKLEDLMAVRKWIPTNNEIVYKRHLFDKNNKEWVRDVSYPKQIIPTDLEAYEEYLRILEIEKDIETGFVSISIDHYSPIISKNWLDVIIYNINESMREQDIQLANSSINFLNEYAKLATIQSLKDATASLLENQMQVLMLASSNESYVFKMLDSPFIPEEKSGPNRFLFLVLGTFLGFVLSILILYLQSSIGAFYKK